MDISSISSNGLNLQSTILNQIGGSSSKVKTDSNSAYYAKKGEPMYLKEMDADEDGVVSFDEFKDYCQSNGISSKEMVRMVEMANSYRTMKAQEKTAKEIENKSSNINTQSDIKEAESDAVYARRGDGKYDEAMDTNNDDKVTYKEYIEYCKENANPHQEKANTKVEETDNGELKITNSGKASESYSKSEANESNGMVDDLV